MPCLKLGFCDWTVPSKVSIVGGVVNTPEPTGYPPEIAQNEPGAVVGNTGAGQEPGNPKGPSADDASKGGLLTSPCPPIFHEESWKMAYPARSTVVWLPSTFQLSPIRGWKAVLSSW